jgi:hypothetical protein
MEVYIMRMFLAFLASLFGGAPATAQQDVAALFSSLDELLQGTDPILAASFRPPLTAAESTAACPRSPYRITR